MIESKENVQCKLVDIGWILPDSTITLVTSVTNSYVRRMSRCFYNLETGEILIRPNANMMAESLEKILVTRGHSCPNCKQLISEISEEELQVETKNNRSPNE